MKIFILTLGTRGDVQPYVALGQGLQAAGHTVVLCTCSSFQSFVSDCGLQYGFMNDGFIEFMSTDIARDAMENVNNVWAGMRYACRMWKQSASLQRSAIADGWLSAQQAAPDLILFHPKTLVGAAFAEKMGVPSMMAFYLPLYAPTSEKPAPGFPRWNLGGWYNRLTYAMIYRITMLMTGSVIREWRMENQLSPLSPRYDILHTRTRNPIPILYGFSPQVISVPSDWPGHVKATGYWFLNRREPWEPSAELLQFLEAGEPPVYVGFGSISGRNPERMARIIIEGLQLAKARGVLAMGWGGLSVANCPETIHTIKAVPHDWLFPRMAAIAHHGGAGTTAAGLRAGRPAIICPFFGDQPYWGRRVRELGVGCNPIPQKKLTPQNFAAAVREAIANPSILANAAALGEKLRRENGVANAVAFIERMMNGIS